MIIRSAAISDIGEITAIEHRSFDPSWSEAMIEAEFSRDDTYIIVCEIEKQIAGYCIVHDISDFAEILKIAVDTNFRRIGIAKELLAQCESDFREEGKDKIILEVNEKNISALSLYLSTGYTQTGKRNKYYGENAALLMEKKLK